jgi:hypothetical protein
MHAYRDPGGVPSTPAPAAPEVVICRACGVVAPEKGSVCAVCKRALGETRVTVPGASAETFWVAVRCGFTCNSCKFLAPLDALDADGAVECAHCGLRQRFEVAEWRDGLAFAHAVGDLAGPSPEGRAPHPTLWIGSENPYAKVGSVATFERTAASAGKQLDVEAAPGHPVCRKCHVPVSVSSPAPGAVITRCGQCGDQHSYALTDAERALSDAVVAVVADEHLADRKRAQTRTTEAGVTTLTCPACGAPLSLGDGGRLVTCSFCKAACLVSARLVAQRTQAAPEPSVWWILFRGPSAKRRELEAPTADAPSVAAAALNILKPGAQTEPIGDAPGVYDAPEVGGIYWPQVGLTVLLGSAAVAVGFVIYEAFF